MYGLCSTDWFNEQSCFDFDDQCSRMGGECRHPGVGDHGEGCVCVRRIYINQRTVVVILTNSHLDRGRYEINREH
ncbi:hypothetical protein ACF0H5_022793 [Mactra antiquata]